MFFINGRKNSPEKKRLFFRRRNQIAEMMIEYKKQTHEYLQKKELFQNL